MSLQTIGNYISELRKIKGVTQEELAKAVGVSTQAVSKWECGGMPDTELLPRIADYFCVSIDRLFGRSVNDYGDLKTELAKTINETPIKDRFLMMLDYCWAMQQGFFYSIEEKLTPLNEVLKKQNDMQRVYSQMIYDEGITLMRLNGSLPYFLLMPEPECGYKDKLAFNDEYCEFFKNLGDTDLLKALYFLNDRENKPFTPKLFESKLGMAQDKAAGIISKLVRYKLLYKQEVELDDETQIAYSYQQNPAFIALLAISDELIKRPNGFYCTAMSRKKPLLKA